VSTNAEMLVTIFEIWCDMPIFCYFVQNGAVSTLVIFGVTGPIFIKIAQNVAIIL